MIFDIVMALVAGLLVLRGWLRGFYRSVAGTIGLVAGYGISYASARPVGDKLWGAYPTLPRPIAWSLAAFAVFIVVNLAVVLTGDALLRARVKGLPPEDRRPFLRQNRRGGACMGLLRGALLVLFISLAAALIPVDHRIARLLGADESKLVNVVRPLVHPIIKKATSITVGDDESGEILSAVLRDPEAARTALEAVWAKEDFQALLADPEFVAAAESGNTDAMAEDERLIRLMGEADVQDALRSLGVDLAVDQETSPGDTARALARTRKVVKQLAPFLEAVQAASKTDRPATEGTTGGGPSPTVQDAMDALSSE